MLTKFLTLVRNPLESTVIMREIMKTFLTWIIRVFAIPVYIISGEANTFRTRPLVKWYGASSKQCSTDISAIDENHR